jgi:uncharacterized membrane-anchored protein YhcB (DUF1043 family)
MTMLTAEFITIIGTVIGTGLALGVGLAMLIMRSTARVDADRRSLQTSMDSFRAAMDTFRAEMQRLGERQSRLEGMHEGHERSHGTAD